MQNTEPGPIMRLTFPWAVASRTSPSGRGLSLSSGEGTSLIICDQLFVIRY